MAKDVAPPEAKRTDAGSAASHQAAHGFEARPLNPIWSLFACPGLARTSAAGAQTSRILDSPAQASEPDSSPGQPNPSWMRLATKVASLPHAELLEARLGTSLAAVRLASDPGPGSRGSAGPGWVGFRGAPSVRVAAHEVVHALRAGHPEARSHGDLGHEERIASRVAAAVEAGRPLGGLARHLHEPGFRSVFRSDGELEAALELARTIKADLRVAFLEAGDAQTLAHELSAAIESHTDDEEHAEVDRVVQTIAHMTEAVGDEQLGWVEVRDRLQDMLGNDVTLSDVPQVSFGVTLWLDSTAGDAAFSLALAAAPDEAPLTFVGNLRSDLYSGAQALVDAEAAWQLELDGTVAELTLVRREFSQPGADRTALGPEIGELGRRALMVDERLRAVRDLGAHDQGALATALEQVPVELDDVRRRAGSEQSTRDYFGDDPLLLSEMTLSEGMHTVDDHRGVSPEELFPEATDAASRRWIADLREHLEGVSETREQLEDAVVPRNPSYSLDEFVAVYRRWSAFRSPAQEALDPIWSLVRGLMYQVDSSGQRRDAFTVAGMGSGLAAVSGGIGRALWVRMFSDLLPAHAGISTDFGREIAGAPLRTSVSPITSVSSDLRLRSDYVEGGRTRGSSSLALGRVERTRTQFEAVAERPVLEQPEAAREQGIAHAAGLPLSGAASAAAREGWRYLIDVWDPMASDEPVMQDARSVPPEVAAYLLARRREVDALSRTTTPQTAEGVRVGEADVRSRGVEAATGTASATYLQGQTSPDVDPAIERHRSAIASLRSTAGVEQGRGSPDPVSELLRRFNEYFDLYFQRPHPADQMIGTVLTISNEDWGTGAQVLATLSVDGMVQIAMEVGKQALIFGILGSLGRVGTVLRAGYRAYLQTQGVDEVAAIITLAAFLREAATASSFQKARGLGFMAFTVEADLVELIEAAAGGAMQHGMSRLASSPPRTASEAATHARQLGATPEAHAAMLASIEAELASLPANDPSRGGLIALRDSLTGERSPDADGNHALPDPTNAAARIEFAEFTPRSDAERAALEAEIPTDLRGQVPVVEAPLPPGVVARVVYDTSSVRIEVSREAGPSDVRQHVRTARQLVRFTGVRGVIRRLIDRIRAFATGDPRYGTAGFEARLEIEKLETIEAEVNAELEQIRRDGGDPHALEARLSDLHGQIAEYEAAIRSAEAGRGWIAAGRGVGNQSARAAGLIAPAGHYYRVQNGNLVLVRYDSSEPHYRLATITIAGTTQQWPVERGSNRRYMQELFDAVGEQTAWATIQQRMAFVQAGVASTATPKQQQQGVSMEAALRFQHQEATSMLSRPAPPVTAGSRILDTQLVRQITDVRAKVAAGVARQGQELRVEDYEASLTNPDYRITNMVGAELDPNRAFAQLPSTPLTVPRDSPTYRATLADLASNGVGTPGHGSSGGGNAAADQAIIADVLHAQTAVGTGPATFVTADFHLARSLYAGYVGGEHVFTNLRASRATPGTPVTFTITVNGQSARIEYVGK